VGPDLRLLPAAAAAWALTWWATAERAGTVLAVAAVLVISVGVLLSILIAVQQILRPGSRLLRTAAATLVVAIGAAVLSVTGLRLLDRERDPLTRAAVSKATVSAVGRVSGDPRQLATPSRSAAVRYVVRLAVDELTVRGRTVQASGQLVVLGNESWGAVVAGSRVRVSGKLAPGERGEAASAIVFPRSSPRVVDPGSWVWQTAERLRIGLRTACRGLPDDARGLLPALVVGDTSELSPQLRSDLQAAGLTHLTAVSGANVAVVAAVAVATIAALGGGRRLRVAGSALAIIGFVVLARPEPSVLRAAVMGGLALIGLLWARRGAGIPLLATTTVALLMVDPWLSRSYGFVLSVLATAGLVLLVPAWVQRFDRWPRSVVLALAVPVAAQLATAPVTVLLNPAISLVAVPANLVVAAAVAPATVAGVGAAAVSPVWPSGAHLVALVGGLATQWIAVVAHRAAALPGGSVPWPQGLSGAILLAVISVVLVTLSLRRSWLVLGVGLVLVAGCLTAPRWVDVLTANSGKPPADWAVVQCDVGQGSSTLIRSGPERAVIVDTGPEPEPVDKCLRRAGVNALDLVVLTHFHADHVGGLKGAVHGRGHPPVVVSPLAEPDDQVRAVRAIAASARLPIVIAAAGMAGALGAGEWLLRWRLLPPTDRALVTAPVQLDRPVQVRQLVQSERSERSERSGRLVRGGLVPGSSRASEPQGTEINNASVVLFAEVRGLRVMALGDVEPEAQRPLLRTILARGATAPVAVTGSVAVPDSVGPTQLVGTTEPIGVAGSVGVRKPVDVAGAATRARSASEAQSGSGTGVASGAGSASEAGLASGGGLASEAGLASGGGSASGAGSAGEAQSASGGGSASGVGAVGALHRADALDAPMAPVDVVVVAHHGSARQEPRLYRLLRPRVALIGVGAGNDYGHPAPSALTMLRQLGALSLRTDLQGQLAVSGPSDRLRVVTAK
jgi:competence protein ComEC